MANRHAGLFPAEASLIFTHSRPDWSRVCSVRSAWFLGRYHLALVDAKLICGEPFDFAAWIARASSLRPRR